MSNGIYWTKDEWVALGTTYSLVRKNTGRGRVTCFNDAMRQVIEPSRWRKITAWSEVEPKLVKYCGYADKPVAPAPKQQPKVVDRREQNPIQVAAETLIAEIVKEVAGTIGLLVMDEVRRQLDGAIKGLDKRILDALPKQVEVPATPTQQHISITTSDAVPDGVDKVTIAPTERKPRVCVAGLMNQQINDVRFEFGNIIDFSFIKTEKGSTSDVATMQGKDLVICMTRFSSHAVEKEARVAGVPVVRITGAVSMLKRWLRSWINHEIAITEAA